MAFAENKVLTSGQTGVCRFHNTSFPMIDASYIHFWLTFIRGIWLPRQVWRKSFTHLSCKMLCGYLLNLLLADILKKQQSY